VSGQQNALYRAFNSEGDLLYVGISLSPLTRIRQHRQTKDWWTEIANITIESFPDRSSASHAEVLAIQEERPRYNVVHNVSGKPTSRVTPAAQRGRDVYLYYRGGDSNGKRTRLSLNYEVYCDPYGDYFGPECSARDVLTDWSQYLDRDSPHGDDVSIWWYIDGPVTCENAIKTDAWPHSFEDYFYPPECAISGDLIAIRDLPVVDKTWNVNDWDKGGFIPVATGWKPEPLQQSVSRRALFAGARKVSLRHARTLHTLPAVGGSNNNNNEKGTTA
jgi:hypothetical protein